MGHLGRPLGWAAIVPAVRRTTLWLLAAVAGCASTAPTPLRPSERPRPRFDPDALFEDTRALLTVPRVLGDPARADGIAQLHARLEAGGATVTTHAFSALDPGTGTPMALTNLYGSVRPEAPRQFVLATHFDIRPWAESDPDPSRRNHPIPGANDGTSGVVVALALLPQLAGTLPDDVGFTVALFDGEELGRPGAGGYCAGSRQFLALPETAPAALSRASFGIVLDMVGDAELALAREPNSTRQNGALNAHIWATAASLGERAFVDATYPHAILDDHVYLSRAGIPSVLLIDYDYDAWHTHADTLDRVSGESLATVATVVFEAVHRSFPPQ